MITGLIQQSCSTCLYWGHCERWQIHQTPSACTPHPRWRGAHFWFEKREKEQPEKKKIYKVTQRALALHRGLLCMTQMQHEWTLVPWESTVSVKALRFMITTTLCVKGSAEGITLAGSFRRKQMTQEETLTHGCY